MKTVEPDNFNLADYLPDSLSVQVNCTAPTRSMQLKPFQDPYAKIFERDPMEVLGEQSTWEPQTRAAETLGSPVQEFYRGLNIFITGGTGFLGKILIEKLIRSVPNLRRIYILVRGKRGKNAEERFNEIWENQMFRRMKAEVPDWATKLVPVEGDLSSAGLGLTPEHHQLICREIHVVFHSAADVRFVEPLKSSLASNVVGTMRVLQLAREMKNLRAFVHVSTAYSQCVLRKVPESVLKTSTNYKEILNFSETQTDEELEKVLLKLMQGWPNTYTFTKAVCENMIEEEGIGLPLCIFRPAVVGTTFNEPVRGWTDNLYGPTGLFVGAGMGVVHCFRMDGELCLDFVPVDYVANGMIAAATDCHIYREPGTMKVYNYVSTPEKTENWKYAVRSCQEWVNYAPLYKALYYPTFFATSNDTVDYVTHFFLHKIPAKLIDWATIAAGQKPRLSKIFQRIEQLKQPLRYFSCRQWEFEKENVRKLWESLNEEDQRLFNFDIKNYDQKKNLVLSTLGVRYYYLKEGFENQKMIEIKHNVQKWIHYSVKFIFSLVVLKGLAWTSHQLPI